MALMSKQISWPVMSLVISTILCVPTGLYIMGTSGEFPSSYCMSIRRLTPAILSMRPAEVESITLPATVPTASKFNFMLHVNASSILSGVDINELKREVTKLEQHFRSIGAFSEQGANPSNFRVDPSSDDDFRLTSMANLYNIFFLSSASVGRLYWAIKIAFHQYAKAHQLDLGRWYFIHGWFNCFRGGSKIKPHSHGYDAVSGNLAIHVPPGSFTHYLKSSMSSTWQPYKDAVRKCRKGKRCACPLKWPYGTQITNRSELGGEDLVHWNEEGELMLFHSTTQHESSNVTNEMRQHLRAQNVECRMTAAWDITPHPDLGLHTVPLYDPMDPWWKNDPEASHGEGMNDEIESTFRAYDTVPTFEWDTTPDTNLFWDRWDSCDGMLRAWCGFLSGSAINQTMRSSTRSPYLDHSANRVAFLNQLPKPVFMFWYDPAGEKEELVWTLLPQAVKSRPTKPGDIWLFRDGPNPEHTILRQFVMTHEKQQNYMLHEPVESAEL